MDTHTPHATHVCIHTRHTSPSHLRTPCAQTRTHAHTWHTYMHAEPYTHVTALHTDQAQVQALTLSLGSRLMVLRGRRTRKTLRDLMVLMSFPLDPLEGRSHTCGQQDAHPRRSHKAARGRSPERSVVGPRAAGLGKGRPLPRQPQGPPHPSCRSRSQASSEQTKARPRAAAPGIRGKPGFRVERSHSHRPHPPSLCQGSPNAHPNQLHPAAMLTPTVGLKR